MIRQFVQLSTLLGFSSAHAEVADKCPAFVSQWEEAQGAWNFLSPDDAVFRLAVFAVVYSAIAIGAHFLLLRSKQTWAKFIPLAMVAIVGVFLIFDFLPLDGPCSQYLLQNEMPTELYRIQILFDLILLAVPLFLVVSLGIKRRK